MPPTIFSFSLKFSIVTKQHKKGKINFQEFFVFILTPSSILKEPIISLSTTLALTISPPSRHLSSKSCWFDYFHEVANLWPSHLVHSVHHLLRNRFSCTSPNLHVSLCNDKRFWFCCFDDVCKGFKNSASIFLYYPSLHQIFQIVSC